MADHNYCIYSHSNISAKLCIDSFVAVKLYSDYWDFFPEWIKNIVPDVKTGETYYFWNHEGYYYDSILYVWKKMTVIIRIEVMYVIYFFTAKNPHGKSRWGK